MSARLGEGHHKATITDAQVRAARALREIRRLTIRDIAEILDQNWRSIEAICAYRNRRSAGPPELVDLMAADRLIEHWRAARQEALQFLASRMAGMK